MLRSPRRYLTGFPALQIAGWPPGAYRVVSRFLLLALLSGCTPNTKVDAPQKPSEKPVLVFPPAPNTPRFMYETDLRSAADIAVETKADLFRKLAGGDAVSRENVFVKPYAVAARHGRIYVTDTLAKCVHVFDVPRRRYFRFGYRFEGRLQKPLGLDVDDTGRVYVADVVRKTVIVYDSLGMFLMNVGDSSQLTRPTDVAVYPDGSRVYVVDTGGVESQDHRIVVYDGQGQKQLEFGGRGSEPGKFNLPVAASVGPDGVINVLDAGNFRVQKFDRDGHFLKQWGDVGQLSGQFARPRDLATDASGNVYVSDAIFGNVQIFTAEGQLLMSLGRIGKEDRPGRFTVLAGIAVDETRRLYAVDQVYRRVSVFSSLNAGTADTGSGEH